MNYEKRYGTGFMKMDEAHISDKREWTKAKRQESMGCISGIYRVYEVRESLENLTCVQSYCEYH